MRFFIFKVPLTISILQSFIDITLDRQVGSLSSQYYGSFRVLYTEPNKSILNNRKSMISVLLLLVEAIVSQTSYDPSLYQYAGSNLAINPSFTEPVMHPSSTVQNYLPNIVGWNCTTYCQFKNIPKYCQLHSLTCNVNYTQAIDLDSQNILEDVSQQINITTQSNYLLQVEWIAPFAAQVGKSFRVEVNGTTIMNIDVGTTNYSVHIAQVVISLQTGIVLLNFRMNGVSADAFGAHLCHVDLKQLTPIDHDFQNALSSIIFNNFTSAVNMIPGSRIFVYTLTNFMTTFDKFQFYFYHKHNLSYYSEVFLSNVNTLSLEKGSITQRLIENCQDVEICVGIKDAYKGLLQSLDHQYNYTEPEFLVKNPQGIGFFANNLEFFFYELPLIIGIYFIFSLIFRMLFNYRISKYLRKYSFYGILLLVVYEGNIEQFAFYFFSQCRLLFSASLTHKFARVFMLFFFWLLLIFVFGGLTWLWVHYRKLVKYFMEDSKKISLESIVLESLERSIFPLVFGAVHALLIDNLLIQSIILGLVELCYFCAKIYSIRSSLMRYKFRLMMLSISSLLRMVLIVTLYLFESQGNPTVINLIHYDLIWVYLVCWLTESIFDTGILIKQIKEATSFICNKKDSKGKNKSKSKRSLSKKKEKQRADKKSKSKSKSRSKLKKQQSKKQSIFEHKAHSLNNNCIKKPDNSKSKDKKVKFKSQSKPKEQLTIKSTFYIEMPDKTRTPTYCIYQRPKIRL